jgi:hypothetical protein
MLKTALSLLTLNGQDHHVAAYWYSNGLGAHRLAADRRCQDGRGAAQLLQLRRGVLVPTVDGGRRAQLTGQRLLVLAAGNAHGVKAHLRGILHPEVAEPAQAEYGDHVPRPRAAVPQRVEHGHAGTHQRGGLARRQPGRHRSADR